LKRLVHLITIMLMASLLSAGCCSKRGGGGGGGEGLGGGNGVGGNGGRNFLDRNFDDVVDPIGDQRTSGDHGTGPANGIVPGTNSPVRPIRSTR
jgi:hypothetical protein